jgi:tetratricopeptide (TPR) repeat protein
MSMKSYVFPDAHLARLAKSYVWLSIDSEDPKAADVLAHFPSSSLPTLWVIDPSTERAALKWIGSATVSELEGLLDDAAVAVEKGDSGGEAAAAFVRGNQATGAGKLEDAVREYKKALAVAPPEWKRRPQVVEALSMRLDELRLHADVVLLAAAEIPKLPPGTSLANVVQNGLSAAYSLPKDAPARAKLPMLVQEAKRIAGDTTLPILADDRSGVYEHVIGVLHDSDPPAAKKLARDWATFLEGEANKAPTPTARAVFAPHRLLAYIELGEVERALPMLAESERDLPGDYNPPARLARAYFELHRFDEAKAAMGRALALAYGPRRLQLLLLDAEIEDARGDRAAARKALEDARVLATAKGLPPRYAKTRDEIARRLATH